MLNDRQHDNYEVITGLSISDNFYIDKNFDNYSTTSLVILKTEIQVDKLKNTNGNDNR